MAERVLASDYHDLCQHLQNSGTGDAGTDRRTKENLEIMESNVYRLKYKLLTISELYHDICVPYKLWDISLLLLHASKSGDLDLVAKLWRSLIYRSPYFFHIPIPILSRAALQTEPFLLGVIEYRCLYVTFREGSYYITRVLIFLLKRKDFKIAI